jgi:hypothetical protein
MMAQHALSTSRNRISTAPAATAHSKYRVNGWHKFPLNLIATDVTLID